jgi:CheY-like chemotaxis protein
MDINMPEMDGFEAIEYLKNCQKSQHIPVIALVPMPCKKILTELWKQGLKIT